MVFTKVWQIKRVDSLKYAIRYILDEAKTLEGDLDYQSDFPIFEKAGKLFQQLASGHLIGNPKHAAAEMILTKKLADQRAGREETSDLKTGEGVLAHHIVQSFSPEDNLTAEQIHEIGRQTVLELTGGHYEVVMATHVDKNHIHNHIIFSTTNTKSLKKFRWQKWTKGTLEKISDRLADLAGAKIIDKDKALMSHTSYGAYRKKFSYKQEIKSRLNFLVKQSSSLSDFKAKAAVLNLAVDFSGKFATYRLLDHPQERNTRDSALSKKGAYSLATIEKRVAKNKVVHSVSQIRSAYDQLVKERESDFEMRLTIEPWQVKEETQTGLYLQVSYGLHNQGLIKIPRQKVDPLEDGKFELFLKKSDFFYFMNADKSENNRYIRGNTLMRQLAYNNGQVVLNKHANISKLNQLIKEFEFLSQYEITAADQFEELSQRFMDQLEETEKTLDLLDLRIEKCNKLSSALLAYEEGTEAGQAIFDRYQLSPDKLNRAQLEKQILETTVERQVLQEKLDSIIGDYKTYEKVRDHAHHRREESEKIL